MSDDTITLKCGCDYSPSRGLLSMACGQGEDEHQAHIKEAQAKKPKDK